MEARKAKRLRGASLWGSARYVRPSLKITKDIQVNNLMSFEQLSAGFRHETCRYCGSTYIVRQALSRGDGRSFVQEAAEAPNAMAAAEATGAAGAAGAVDSANAGGGGRAIAQGGSRASGGSFDELRETPLSRQREGASRHGAGKAGAEQAGEGWQTGERQIGERQIGAGYSSNGQISAGCSSDGRNSNGDGRNSNGRIGASQSGAGQNGAGRNGERQIGAGLRGVRLQERRPAIARGAGENAAWLAPGGGSCDGLCILNDAKLCRGGALCGGIGGAGGTASVSGSKISGAGSGNGSGSKISSSIGGAASRSGSKIGGIGGGASGSEIGCGCGNACGAGFVGDFSHQAAKANICDSALCARSYYGQGAERRLMEPDCGDYRLIAGPFIRRLASGAEHDEKFRRDMRDEWRNISDFEDSVRSQTDDSIDVFLLRRWKEYSLDEFLEAFPQIDRKPSRMEMQVLIYMFSQYRLNITLEHFEGRFMLAHNMINRYLRLYFGCSYTNLLYAIRNAHSKLLLLIPMLRIGEIAALVGYKSNFHYSLCFKRLEGVSPKEYREAHVKQRLSRIITERENGGYQRV